MILRLEVGRGQRRPFAWFLRGARRHPSFRFERGEEVAVLEFAEWRELAPYFQPISDRSYVSVYKDDVLLTREAVIESIYLAQGLTKFGTPPDIADPNNLHPKTTQMLRDVLPPDRPD